MKIDILELPEYSVAVEPDFKSIGKKIDDFIKVKYLGKSIAIRALSSDEHENLTRDQLIEIISCDGTDRYDPDRVGDRYENIEGKQIDLFALPLDPLQADSVMFEHMLDSFYHYPLKTRGYPVRVDIVIIYDLNQLAEVVHHYDGREETKRDGFVFKNQENKQTSVLGVIQIG